MANDRDGYENDTKVDVDPRAGAGGHSGTAMKQGLHGHAVRTEERGRDEFNGRGESADLDQGRSESSGRHYGRSGDEEPGPGYGRGPLQPEHGTVVHAENKGIDDETNDSPQDPDQAARAQDRHGEAPFAQGRDEAKKKQMMPEDKSGKKPGSAKR